MPKLYPVAGLLAVAAIMVMAVLGARSAFASFSDRVVSGDTTMAAGALLMTVDGDTTCATRSFGGAPSNPGADGNVGCTVGPFTFSSGFDALVPGAQATTSFTLTNAGTLPGTLSMSSAPAIVTGGLGVCGPENLSIAFSGLPPGGSLAPSATATVTATAILAASAPTECQTATFTAAIDATLILAGTGFSDRLSSTGNVLTASSLDTPTLTAANGSGAINVSWTRGANGAAPASWQLFRFTGSCGAWAVKPGAATQLTGNPTPYTLTSYTDTTATAGQTYCYAIRGVNGQWLSPFSATGAGTESSLPLAVNTVYFDDTSGGNTAANKQLSTTNHRGYEQYGCLIAALGACIDLQVLPTQYTFTSASQVQVTGNANWTADLNALALLSLNVLSGRTLNVEVWYTGGACSSGPAGQTPVASVSGSAASLLALTLGASQPVQLSLVGASGFVPSSGPVNLCSRISLTGGTTLGVASYLTFVNGTSYNAGLLGTFTFTEPSSLSGQFTP